MINEGRLDLGDTVRDWESAIRLIESQLVTNMPGSRLFRWQGFRLPDRVVTVIATRLAMVVAATVRHEIRRRQDRTGAKLETTLTQADVMGVE